MKHNDLCKLIMKTASTAQIRHCKILDISLALRIDRTKQIIVEKSSKRTTSLLPATRSIFHQYRR